MASMVGVGYSRLVRVAAGLLVAVVIAPSALTGADEPTVDELKGRVANAAVADRPRVCVRISERQLDAADGFYSAGDNDKAQAALTDVIAFSELARDYAIQSRKHEKQAEIAIRKMVRKLADMKHTVSREEQEQVQRAIDRLQRVRDDLLAAMFPNGGKK
jgi:hypothetical protein